MQTKHYDYIFNFNITDTDCTAYSLKALNVSLKIAVYIQPRSEEYLMSFYRKKIII